MKKATFLPYLIWMIMFIVIPLILVLFYAFTVSTPEGYKLSLDNCKRFFEPVYLKVILRSLGLALVSTLICLVLGYPVAMIMAGNTFSRRDVLMLLFVVPMWMNFLLRTYAWLAILERNGILNIALSWLKLPSVNILYTNAAVVLGMVYNFLPFIVLPIYSVLRKIDKGVIEAAHDLGANPVGVFTKVILPLSVPGIVSGVTMVFMPALTTFIISRLLGGGQFTLIGNLIEQQFLVVGDWGFGSAISVIMIVFILLSMGIMSFFEDADKEKTLW